MKFMDETERNKYFVVSLVLFLICNFLIITGLPIETEGYQKVPHCTMSNPVNTIDDFNIPKDEVIFVSTKETFAPVLTVEKGTRVAWTFADGSTSTSPSPVKSYGTTAKRMNTLRVIPWSGLIRVNIGYDGSDGGSASIEHVTPQGVIAIYNMYLMAPYLRQWCSSYNPIRSLSFDNFTNLETLECYKTSQLNNVSMHNTPRLTRVCFEECKLTSLDFSQSPSLADLRAARNFGLTITWGTTGRNVWHICTHDIPSIHGVCPDFAWFPHLKDLWIWNDGLSGRLVVTSRQLRSAFVQGNRFDFSDFSGCFPEPNENGMLNVSENHLKSLIIDRDPGLINLDAHKNQLSAKNVETILYDLDKSGRHNGFVNLQDNAALTKNARIFERNLKSKGWTVIIEEESFTERLIHRISHIIHKIIHEVERSLATAEELMERV